jgi:hypothetical protein
MFMRAGQLGEAAVNATATALLSRYPNAASLVPPRGGVLLTGVRSDGADADAPEPASRHLADLGHLVVPREDSR